MSERQVEPMGLVYYGNSWHLLAYCLQITDSRVYASTPIIGFSIRRNIGKGLFGLK